MATATSTIVSNWNTETKEFATSSTEVGQDSERHSTIPVGYPRSFPGPTRSGHGTRYLCWYATARTPPQPAKHRRTERWPTDRRSVTEPFLGVPVLGPVVGPAAHGSGSRHGSKQPEIHQEPVEPDPRLWVWSFFSSRQCDSNRSAVPGFAVTCGAEATSGV